FSTFSANAQATTEISTLSLHDALPIYALQGMILEQLADRRSQQGRADCTRPFEVQLHLLASRQQRRDQVVQFLSFIERVAPVVEDRKSTRLNSSHLGISYAVFCLKKKK